MNIIPAILYHNIYLILVAILSIIYFNTYIHRVGGTIRLNPKSERAVGFIILLIFVLFIGLRPISDIFVDMTQYQGIYNRWSGYFEFDWNAQNLIYDNAVFYLASIQFPPILFYFCIAAIYFGCNYYACIRLFPNDYIPAFIVFLAAFSSFSYATNGIKGGAAAAIFILALSFRDNLKISIPLIAISWGVHHAMQLPVSAFVLARVYKNTKTYLIFWCLCIIMALAHITTFQNLFANLTDEKGAGYLMTEGTDWGGKGGLRLDFILYSAMPVFVGYWAIYRKKIKISTLYSFILNIYLITNGIWMLCMYVNYNNRIAYLSWLLYPIVLVYPVLKENWNGNRYKTFAKFAYLHLAFTLAMHFIYYA